jgi:hypothetical protein
LGEKDVDIEGHGEGVETDIEARRISMRPLGPVRITIER